MFSKLLLFILLVNLAPYQQIRLLVDQVNKTTYSTNLLLLRTKLNDWFLNSNVFAH